MNVLSYDMCLSFNKGRGITGGKLVIEVAYFGWHIHSETHDLCSETTCPVETGDFLVAHSQVLPGYTPPVSSIRFLFIGSCYLILKHLLLDVLGLVWYLTNA